MTGGEFIKKKLMLVAKHVQVESKPIAYPLKERINDNQVIMVRFKHNFVHKQ